MPDSPGQDLARHAFERWECPGLNGRPMACRLELRELPDGRWLAVATEIAGNPGASVTNAAEVLATWVAFRFEIEPDRLVWVEHYGPDAYPKPPPLPCRRPQFRRASEFDLVKFTLALRWGGAGFPPLEWHLADPDWRPATPADWQSWGLPAPEASAR